MKVFEKPDYNFFFNEVNGFFVRYGKTIHDDPNYSPYGPEILDLEVSTICKGIDGKPCSHCYKDNNSKGKNMSFEEFKIIFHKIPETLTQIAFGIGSVDSNPDLFKMFEYCRLNKVVPNVTINGDNLTDVEAYLLHKFCGAVSVSCYEPEDICYEAVKKLTDLNMKQINIHMLVAEETYEKCFGLMRDYQTDVRLRNMNALVFLLLKPKGARNKLTQLKNKKKYKKIVDYAFKHNIRIGFDSCSAPLFLHSVKGNKNFEQLEIVCESCESSLFSSYINVEGKYYPCSFTEEEEKGIDVLNCNDFLKDVWFHDDTIHFRESLINQKHDISSSCRECPAFDLY